MGNPYIFETQPDLHLQWQMQNLNNGNTDNGWGNNATLADWEGWQGLATPKTLDSVANLINAIKGNAPAATQTQAQMIAAQQAQAAHQQQVRNYYMFGIAAVVILGLMFYLKK